MIAYGTGRVIGDEALAPASTDWMFLARDVKSETFQEPESQQFREEDQAYSGGDFFTPGLAAIPYRLTFEFPADYQPQPTIRLVVADLVYEDTTLLQTGELRWANDEKGYSYDLPLRRLPDAFD